MKKWEYWALSFCTTQLSGVPQRGPAEQATYMTEELNRLGKEGWELVGLVPEGPGHLVFMKREIPQVKRRQKKIDMDDESRG